MLARSLLTAALLATVPFCGGCGTVAGCLTTSGQGELAYSGVRFDVQVIEKLVDGSGPPLFSASDSGLGAGLAAAVFLLGPFADLPLSFAADTLAYPLTAWLDSRSQAPKYPPRPPAPADAKPVAPDSSSPPQTTATPLASEPQSAGTP
jgi:hypothetical protein